MKFKEISEKYFTFAKNIVKTRTYLHYLLLYNTHISQFFDEKEISNVTRQDIEEFIEIKNTLSTNSLKLLLCIIKNICNYARYVLDLKVDINFCRKFKTSKSQVQALTKQEQLKIENYIIARKVYYNYGVIVALYTGLRIGELLALTWKDVDFKRKTITINKTVCTVCKDNKTIIIVDTPKTEDSKRIIPLPVILVSILRELQKFQEHKSEFVISTFEGKRIGVRAYQQSFENLLRRLKLKHYGFHSLRHTFATRAIECGVDVKSLSEILGHSNVNITLNRYVHSSFELKKRLINKVGKNLKI